MVTTRSSRSKTGADAASAGDKHTAAGSPERAPASKKSKTTSKKKTAKEPETTTAATTTADDNKSASENPPATGDSGGSASPTATRKPTVEDVTDSEDARGSNAGNVKKNKAKPTTSEDSKAEEPPQKRQKTASPPPPADNDNVDKMDVDDDNADSAAANTANGTEESAKERAQAAEASPILEKGLVYFFLRGKVDVEHPESMDEVKRSYMVLRPIPMDKSIPAEDGKPVKDDGKARLIAIPKKRLPSKGYEKFLMFVEEPGAPPREIGEKWLKGRTYSTKTKGERTDYPAEPIGEGVYAITKTDDERQSHFAYMLTVPEKLEEIQDDFGLKQKGSFVVSVRNPKNPAPANAGIPDPAEYSKEIMDEFEGLKWAALQPKHLDYKNAEILFIGEKTFPEDGEHEGTEEELSKLVYEDEQRVKHLNDTDAVFADLEKSGKELGGFQTTWGE